MENNIIIIGDIPNDIIERIKNDTNSPIIIVGDTHINTLMNSIYNMPLDLLISEKKNPIELKIDTKINEYLPERHTTDEYKNNQNKLRQRFYKKR